MSPKKVLTTDALRKCKKYLKKIFIEPEDAADIKWLNNFLNDKMLRPLINAYDSLIMVQVPDKIEACNYDLLNAISGVLDDVSDIGEYNDEAAILAQILVSAHMQGLQQSINNVVTRQQVTETKLETISLMNESSDIYGTIYTSEVTTVTLDNKDQSHDSADDCHVTRDYRDNEEEQRQPVVMVGISKDKGEQLGLTVGLRGVDGGENGAISRIVVERIMVGSKIEKQNLLVAGDIITEVNGTAVHLPEQLQQLIKASFGIVTLKVIPVRRQRPMVTQLFLRSFFAYEPSVDTLIPCQEAGLGFMAGDILQVLRQDDLFWWQDADLYASIEESTELERQPGP